MPASVPVPAKAAPTMTRQQCGELYREIVSVLFGGARDTGNPTHASRYERVRQRYNEHCPELCGQSGCQ
jgi:hypothetical protein